jgi:ribonuclease HI
MEPIVHYLRGRRIGCASLQETCLEGDDTSIIDGFSFTRHNDEDAKRGGVAIVLDQACTRAWHAAGNARCAPSARVLAVRLSFFEHLGGGASTVCFVSANAPTGFDDDEHALFHAALDAAIDFAHGDDVLIIGAALNASLGVASADESSGVGDGSNSSAGDDRGVLGPHGIPHVNAAGHRMRGFLHEHKLCAATSFFKNAPRDKEASISRWGAGAKRRTAPDPNERFRTWTNPRSKNPYQLDHVLVRQCQRSRVQRAHVMRHEGARFGSDHRPIRFDVALGRPGLGAMLLDDGAACAAGPQAGAPVEANANANASAMPEPKRSAVRSWSLFAAEELSSDDESEVGGGAGAAAKVLEGAEKEVAPLLPLSADMREHGKWPTFDVDSGDEVVAWTEGSVINLGKPYSRGGIGAFFGEGSSSNIAQPLLPDEPQTNNRGEMKAILLALRVRQNDLRAGRPLRIVTASAYSIGCFGATGRNCRARGWRNSKNKDACNVDLIKIALAWREQYGNLFTLEHVFSHRKRDAKSIGYEHADALAVAGASHAGTLAPMLIPVAPGAPLGAERGHTGAVWARGPDGSSSFAQRRSLAADA